MKIRIIVTIGVSFVVGAVAGFLWASNAFKKFQISKEVDLAAQAGMDANTLAMLRLNNTNGAIEQLEVRMDGVVSTLAAWDRYVRQKPDEKTRAWRDRWLTSVKVYHQSYPFKDSDTNLVAMVNSFLATIPGRNPKSTCNSDLCRLDDSRLVRLGLMTNLSLTNNEAK